MEQEIINRINKGYNVDRISKELNLDLKTLYEFILSLRNINNYYYTKIASSADIFLTTKKENADNDVNLTVKNDEVSFLAISDVHVGSLYDSLSRLEVVQNYIDQNNIKVLLNMGDLVDGPTHLDESTKRRIPDLESQIRCLLDVYPYINGANIICLGDHDLKYKTSDGYNVNKALKNDRVDLKVYSSGSGIIKFNNQEVLICHDANDPRIKQRITDNQILLSGHSHQYINRTKYNNNVPSIKIVTPSISNLPMRNNIAPGFLKFDLRFDHGLLINVGITNYIFIENKTYIGNYISYDIKSNSYDNIDFSRSKKKKYK